MINSGNRICFFRDSDLAVPIFLDFFTYANIGGLRSVFEAIRQNETDLLALVLKKIELGSFFIYFFLCKRFASMFI